jgi:hypothetical protein
MTFISLVAKWAEKNGRDPRKILYIVEKGDEDQGDFISRAERLAWKTMALLRDAVKQEIMPDWDEISRMIDSLNPISQILHKYVSISPQRMEMMCLKKNIPSRKR